MSTITPEEWLREFLDSEGWQDDEHDDVHCVRQMIQLLPDHLCGCENHPDDELTLPFSSSRRVMIVVWDNTEGLNPRPEYPTLLTAPVSADTGGPA